VFKILDSWGDHVQYSVFFTELSPMELARLKARLESVIHHEEDQVLIVDLGPHTSPWEQSLECIGRSYHPPARVVVV